MDCSTPGFPVHHHLPEFAKTHVHWVGDAIQPSHPLLPCSPFAFSLSQHQSLFPMSWLFASGGQVLELQHESFQWLFGIDFLWNWLVWTACFPVVVLLVTQSCLFLTPQTVAHHIPLSMGFSRQEYWGGLPFPSPRDLPDPGIEPGSPAWQADSLPSELQSFHSQKSSPAPQFKGINSLALSLFFGSLSHPYMTTRKTTALTIWTFHH